MRIMKHMVISLLMLIRLALHAQGQSIDIPMVWVEGGTYLMGDSKGLKNEMPAHPVTLSSFYIGKYEVTQTIWQKVMGYNPSTYQGCPDCPVEQVSPEMVDSFLVKLNQLTGKSYRLPTEAEWEYAALGGKLSKGYRYSGSDTLSEVGWVKSNADGKTHPIGLKKPNELGIYDMSGNVWELCSDWYDPDFYSRSSSVNPRNDTKAQYRLLRGGSWRSGEERCYSKARNRNIRDHRIGNGGFRLVLDK